MASMPDTPPRPFPGGLSERRTAAARLWRALSIEVAPETLIVVAALYWTLAANGAFFRASLQSAPTQGAASWLMLPALAVAVASLHVLLMAAVGWRRLLKPLLALLTVVAALAGHFMQTYKVYLDPDMVRNVLHSHTAEAGELLSGTLVLHLLLYAALPVALLLPLRLKARRWPRALLARSLLVLGALLAFVAALLSVFQPLSSLMRNHREVRYLITPANIIYSTTRVVAADVKGKAAPREAIGLDAQPGPSWAAQQRPRVLVLVVGETARAANWGLSGYARQTTPQLAALPVVNFAEVSSCGTNTEVSVPCMFAPRGRRDYDESRIRGQESLLHVLARAGVTVHWRDNQSGCKGVCDGLPGDRALDAAGAAASGLCRDGQCYDEALLHDIDARLDAASGTQLWVLHQLGNHGPAYARRHPPAFSRFTPECRSDDLGQCSREQIVNAYDNALLYTDHLLATLQRRLAARAGRIDAAMLYVSDHGESLGESGLFLHGMPYPIAPSEQKRVPMVMWLGDGFAAGTRVDLGCLRERARRPASHDHLFHTVLGLLDVRTALYEPDWDLAAGCRAGM
jgi:lipid A ethanolaminephosphotransferase